VSFVAVFTEDLSSKLSPDAKQRAMNLIFVVPKQRYKSMITDFAKICRGEMTSDALLAYEMG
jgi:hypothetical protein